MNFMKTLAAAAALTLVSFSVSAMDYTVGDLTISKAWTRATPPKAKAGGGFIEIVNNGSEADRLVAAKSDVSGKVELHEMAVIDDIMKMREMKGGIEIPAGETVTLQPGGLHIMFMGLSQPFEEGSTVPVVLTFEKAGDVSIELPVAKMGAKEMGHGAMDHSKMDHSKN
ncbi:copper chaperone PCu(A)C [Roseibium aggregatum]|uniref:Copper chaperone PCu(A)C n=1 Tax=Roseibium aggregatum TaxID=187304 RepID=A0A939J273_9HYPH|nr:copper chaperone PCu(A)C [Roseibium aggregatum]MBN9669237.1 copper chaperone PCu(A)C [Roseibium aggregatum]